ncbi:MAG: Na+/H+ antiporter subunit G [Thermoflexus sp.]|jgi:multicomponent Na+:H+ antiporter subunit G|nr:Na+/H+ antiporter subunit G [Thermoflexus sp.]
MREILSGVLILIGALFMLLGGVGILRMPDLYTRMSATTKVVTLGIGSIMLGVTIHFGELGVLTRALAVIALVLLTTPVAAHMIGRASYFAGVPLCKETVVNELHGHYDLRTHELESIPLAELEPQLLIMRVPISHWSAIAEKTLAETELRRHYKVTVLAVRRGSYVIPNPDGDVRLLAGDELILIGTPEQLSEAAKAVQG